eukprot:2232913-Lingulodinium_polyedra.AAC.1
MLRRRARRGRGRCRAQRKCERAATAAPRPCFGAGPLQLRRFAYPPFAQFPAAATAAGGVPNPRCGRAPSDG